MLRRALPALVGLAALVCAAPPARAQGAPTAQARQDAAKAFSEGVKAFAAKDYALAASRFAEAYRLAPHPNALWNEAQALQRNGEAAPAANTYARFLREAPSDAHDLAAATKSLDELAHKLLRVDVSAPGFDTVLVDDVRVDAPSLYVEPGRHAVEGRKGDQVVRTEVNGDAGAVVTATLTPPPPPAASSASEPPSGPSSSAPAASAPLPPASASPSVLVGPSPTAGADTTSHGWSPVVVYVGAGVTAVLLGVTLWSGFDTLAFKNGTYASAPTGTNYDAGRSRELRTNVLIPFTAGAAAFTAIAALWLVDWHGSGGTHAALGVGPASVTVRGEFR